MAAPTKICLAAGILRKCSPLALHSRNYRGQSTVITMSRTHGAPKMYGGRDPVLPENRKKFVDPDPEGYPSFAEIMKEEREKERSRERMPVNIGLDYKLTRSHIRDFHLPSLSNEELEQAARHRTLKIPLDEVNNCWFAEFEAAHTKRLAEHYGIFRDLFDNAYFYPVVNLQVSYGYDNEFMMPVFRGNVIPPSYASQPPELVSYESDPDSLWTLILTNPDGHLTDNDSEYLHWMIGNIPGCNLHEGETVCDYLQPFPPNGTGFHRHVFVLYKQEKKLDFSTYQKPQNCSCLKQRTFKTADFYEQFEDFLTPVGLRFFQSQYDDSVKNVYHNILDMREPAFEYNHEPYYHPRQSMYPGRQPFDRYYDRYRDKKDIAEEVIRMKMDMISPWKPWKPEVKYPLCHVDLSKPSWLRTKEELVHRRREQFKELPKPIEIDPPAAPVIEENMKKGKKGKSVNRL